MNMWKKPFKEDAKVKRNRSKNEGGGKECKAGVRKPCSFNVTSITSVTTPHLPYSGNRKPKTTELRKQNRAGTGTDGMRKTQKYL